jgi:hypothetical protein
MLMIASGYEDGNDATALRSDLAFKLAQNVLPSSPELSSQPTLRIGPTCARWHSDFMRGGVEALKASVVV